MTFLAGAAPSPAPAAGFARGASEAMSIRASAKAARFTESVIREMTRLANLHGAVNLSQGFPGLPGPGGGEGGRAAGHLRRHQPVRHHLGHALAARGHRGQVHAPVRRRRGPRARGDRHLRLHGGDDRDPPRRARSRRRGGGAGALLRELRPRRRAVRGHAALREDAAAGLGVRPRRAAARLLEEDAGHHRQHAQQPDGQGVHPRRSWSSSPASAASTTRSPSPTRSTSTSCTTARRTSRWRRCPGWPSARSPSTG